MKFTRETAAGLNLIRAYDNQEVRVQEHVLTESFVLTPTEMLRDWRPRRVEDLDRSDFGFVAEYEPEILLLGTGPTLVFPDRGLYAELLGLGAGVEIMDNGAACRTYNVLVNENRAVVVAILMNPAD